MDVTGKGNRTGLTGVIEWTGRKEDDQVAAATTKPKLHSFYINNSRIPMNASSSSNVLST